MTSRYIYCVIETVEPCAFAVKPVGDAEKVFTLHYKDLAAVVSESVLKKYSVAREHTIAHQKVLEAVLTEHTLLPVRFGTVAKDESDIITSLLETRYKELKELLKRMSDKHQYGLKVIWPDINKIFQDIVEENPLIKQTRDELNKMPVNSARNQQMELGRMVEDALADKKETLRNCIVNPLSKIARQTKESNLYGDQMCVNANFLVEKSRQDEFDTKVNMLAETYGCNTFFKYIGPIPPYDFVEINVDF